MLELHDFLIDLSKDGVSLSLEGECQLTLKGDKEAVSRNLSQIKKKKPEIVKFLSNQSVSRLSFAQQSMWAEYQKGRKDSSYNISLTVKMLEGKVYTYKEILDVTTQLLKVHPMLGGVYLVDRNGVPYHKSSNNSIIRPYIISLSNCTQERIQQEIKKVSELYFDLEKESPFRIAHTINYQSINRVSSYITFVFHHIAVDLLSIELVIRNFSRILSGNPPVNEDRPYYNSIYDECKKLGLQQNNKTDFLLNSTKNFHLSIENAAIDLDNKGYIREITLSKDFSATIKNLAIKFGVTNNLIFMAAYGLLLSKYEANKNATFGVPLLNRHEAGVFNTVGFYANVLPLNLSDNQQATIGEFIASSSNKFQSLLNNQHIPLVTLINQGILSSSQFKYLFSFHQFKYLFSDDVAQLLGKLESFTQHGAPVDLLLTVNELPSGYNLQVNYCPDKFNHFTIDNLLQNYLHIIEQLAADKRPIGNIILEPCSVDLFKNENTIKGHTVAPIFQEVSIVDLIESRVRHYPNNIAVMMLDYEMSYQELWTRSAIVAHQLAGVGVSTGEPVGICLNRTPELIVAILAILRLGAYYIPLDPNYPEARTNLIIEISKLKHVVASADTLVHVSDDDIKAYDIQYLEEAPYTPVDLPKLGNALPLYAIYTSGSTGVPKGVLVQESSVLNLLDWAIDEYDADEIKNILASTSICFDISVFEIFLPLVTGNTLFLVENILSLADKCAKFNEVSLINTVPTAMRELLQVEGVPLNVKVINLAGEPLNWKLVMDCYEATNVASVINLYGPTEVTVYSVYARLPRILSTDSKPMMPIGKPVANIHATVVDSNGNNVPLGARGELWLGGKGLALGYLYNKAETNKRFIKTIDANQQNQTLYKTGDSVSIGIDGNLYYHGRLDEQVKLRGYRIELLEIEEVINHYPGVLQSSVLVFHKNEQDYLCAFVESDNKLDRNQLKNHISNLLPSYMVPNEVVKLDKLPLLPNGKINKKALKNFKHSSSTKENTFSTRSSQITESILFIARKVLDNQKLTLEDNFFDNGGNSLTALRFAYLIKQQLQINCKLSDINRDETLGDFVKKTCSKYSSVEEVSIESNKQYPLTPPQRGILASEKLMGEGFYNIAYAYALDTSVDVQALEKSIQQTLWQMGYAGWRIIDDKNHHINVPCKGFLEIQVDVSSIENFIAEEFKEIILKPFDLSCEPGFKYIYASSKCGNDVIIFVLSHLIFDGASFELFKNNLEASYTAITLGETFEESASWLLPEDVKWSTTEENGFWSDYLSQAYDPLCLVQDGVSKTLSHGQPRNIILKAPDELSNNGFLSKLKQHRLSNYEYYLGCFKVAIALWSFNTNPMFGAVYSGRDERTISLPGSYALTLPHIGAVNFSDSIVDTIIQSRNIHQSLMQHQVISPSSLAHKMFTEYQTVFAYQNSSAEKALKLGNSLSKAIDLQSVNTKYPLTCTVKPGVKIHIEFCFNPEIFAANHIESFANFYLAVLTNAHLDLSKPISYLIQKGEQSALQFYRDNKWLDSNRFKQEDIITRFNKIVEDGSDSIAICINDHKLSYAEVNTLSNVVASNLAFQGVAPYDVVGINLSYPLYEILSMLAILKCGASYYSLPEGNNQLHQSQLSSVKATLCITDENINDLFIDSCYVSPNYQDPEKAAYLMFTSGSTGQPKGVKIARHSIVSLVVNTNYISINPGDVILNHSNRQFDASTFEIWGALLNGATLVLPGQTKPQDLEQLYALCKKHSVTHLWLTKSLLDLVVTHKPETLTELKVLIAGGEPLSKDTINSMLSNNSLTGLKLINGYGPTECTTFAATFEINNKISGLRVPIGYPIKNSNIVILNNENVLNPIGSVGEIAISGSGLMLGYLGEQKGLIEIPCLLGTKFYKTGDLGRVNAKGQLECLGRKDNIVKVRGFRVSLNFVEEQLKAIIPDCQGVWVVKEENRLLAFIKTCSVIDTMLVKQQMANKCPDYMLPAEIVAVSDIPLTVNGKIDHKKLLQAKELQSVLCCQTELPNNLVLGIIQKVLKINTLDLTKSFYESGGDSLQAIELIHMLGSKGFKSDLSTLMESATLQVFVKTIKVDENQDKMCYGTEKITWPLTPLQQSMVFQCHIMGDNSLYNILAVIESDRIISQSQLQQAADCLINKHKGLDMVLATTNHGQVMLKKNTDFKLEVETHRLDKSSKPIEVIQNILHKPIDFESSLPIKIALFNMGKQSYIALLVHHAAADSWSINLIAEDLMRFIDEPKIEAEDISYYAYLEEKANRKKQPNFARDLAYWNFELIDSTLLDFTSAANSGEPRTYSMADKLTEELPNVCKKLSELAARWNCSKFDLMLSITYVTLGRFFQVYDFGVGVPSVDRINTDVKKTVGLLLETIIIKPSLMCISDYRVLAENIKNKRQMASKHHLAGYYDLARDNYSKSSEITNPFFNVMFAFDVDKVNLPEGCRLSLPGFKKQTAKSPLFISVKEQNGNLSIHMDYELKFLSVKTVHSLFGVLVNDICKFIDNPFSKFSDFKLSRREKKESGNVVVKSSANALSKLAHNIADVFSQILDGQAFSIEESFFKRGGSSLQLLQAKKQLEARNIFLSVLDLLKNPIPIQLAQLKDTSHYIADVEIFGTNIDHTVIIILPGRMVAWKIKELVDSFITSAQVLVMVVDEPTDSDKIDTIADKLFIKLMNMTFRKISVMGWSYTGFVAHALARRLIDTGQDVENCILLDTFRAQFVKEPRNLDEGALLVWNMMKEYEVSPLPIDCVLVKAKVLRDKITSIQLDEKNGWQEKDFSSLKILGLEGEDHYSMLNPEVFNKLSKVIFLSQNIMVD